jgi:hypothetical protein
VSRRLAAVVCLVLTACAGGKGGEAIALVAYGMIGSLVNRAAGGCYATCEGMNQICNPETGFCEPNACGGGCGDGRHCDVWGPVPRCVNDSLPADLVSAPPAPPPLPVSSPTP